MNTQHFISFCLALIIFVGCESKTNEASSNEVISSNITRDQDTLQRAYEAISLLGDTLYSETLPPAQQSSSDSIWNNNRQSYADSPDLQNTLSWGKSLAERAQFQKAIRIFTRGLSQFPDDPALYRYRGQQYIIVRQFDKAVQDLERSIKLLKTHPTSTELKDIPLTPHAHRSSSLEFEIYYHLGLAYYLQGQYGVAARSYEQSLPYAQSDDDRAAAANWLYMTYRRLGEDEVAEKTLTAIDEEMQVQYPEGYFERLMMYKGLVAPDSLLGMNASTSVADREMMIATHGYGISNFYQTEGDSVLSQQIKEKIVNGKYWAAFGYIAAEADLARRK